MFVSVKQTRPAVNQNVVHRRIYVSSKVCKTGGVGDRCTVRSTMEASVNPFVLWKTRAIFSAEGNLFFQPQRSYLNSGENNIALIKLTVASVHSQTQMHITHTGAGFFIKRFTMKSAPETFSTFNIHIIFHVINQQNANTNRKQIQELSLVVSRR